MSGHQRLVLAIKLLATVALVYNRAHVVHLEGAFLAFPAGLVDGFIFYAIWRSGLTK